MADFPVTYVEIDLPICSLAFGVAPCTATLAGPDPTGTIKCFNTRGTCQDLANFTPVTVTVRFTKATETRSLDITALPYLQDVDYSPAIIPLGEPSLGQRPSVQVNLVNEPSPDTGPAGDPYRLERPYVPWEQGTFAGKFLARHKSLRGLPLRLITGLNHQALGSMEVRHFVIESHQAPGADGRWSITAKDPLKLADGDRAQAPKFTPGKLLGAIDADDMSATLAPAGVGNEHYASSGWMNIGGDEVIGFTRTGDALTFTERHAFGTDAHTHSAGARCQQCLEFDSVRPSAALETLFVDFCDIPSSYITTADWLAEDEAYYRRLVNTLIVEPTPVSELAGELMEQCGLAVWWDELDGQIRFQVLRNISTDAERFDATDGAGQNIVEGSLRKEEQPERRLSWVQVYFGLKNPLLDLEEPNSYLATAEKRDTDAEVLYGGPAIKTIYSRWIAGGLESTADRCAAILLGRYVRPPRHFKFSVYRWGAASPELGEGGRLIGFMEDATGAAEDVPIQNTRVMPGEVVFDVEADEMSFEPKYDTSGDEVPTVTFSANQNNINVRDEYDDGYPAPAHGDTVNVYVNSDVIIGSTSTSVAAMIVGSWPTQAVTGNRTSGSPILSGLSVDTATWAAVGQRVFGTGIPAGAKILTVDSSSQITLTANASSGSGTSTALTVHTVILNLYLRGRVAGPGGKGGEEPAPYNGDPGGTALYTRYGMNLFLDEGDAEVWGGGGGGGEASGDYKLGGGGGAGAVPGLGGANTGPFPPSTAGTATAGGVGSIVNAGSKGGSGGGPGLAGAAGIGGFSNGAGGAAGPAIDGASYVVKTGTGDIRGSETN